MSNMGLFDSNNDASDSTPNSSNESGRERNSAPNTRLVEDAHQWEYEILPLDKGSLGDKIDEKGFFEGISEQVSNRTHGPGLPPVKTLNELGKEGWELVDTMERASASSGEGRGSYTYALLFRRPVEYVEDDGPDSVE